MPYTMNLYANGTYRRNPETGPIAAAAVVMTNRYDHRSIWTHRLPSTPPPTTQRAQLHAIILALEQAHTKMQQTRYNARMDVTIFTDSKYIMGCMTELCFKWMKNGFRNARGRKVANTDLIKQALILEGGILDAGTVDWVWVPSSVNEVANEVVDSILDEMEPGYKDSDSDGPVLTAWEKRGIR